MSLCGLAGFLLFICWCESRNHPDTVKRREARNLARLRWKRIYARMMHLHARNSRTAREWKIKHAAASQAYYDAKNPFAKYHAQRALQAKEHDEKWAAFEKQQEARRAKNSELWQSA